MAHRDVCSDQSFEGLAALPVIASLSVLKFCDWSRRSAIIAVSSEWRSAIGLPARTSCANAAIEAAAGGMAPGDGFWRFFCERLAAEHRIYIPKGVEAPTGVAASWRELFEELYPLCREERDNDQEEEAATFKIAVAARFRSANSALSVGRAVVLPLHQQVTLVREQFGYGKQEALRRIMQEQQQAKGIDIASQKEDEVFQDCMLPASLKNKENLPDASVNGSDSDLSIKGDKKSSDIVADDTTEAKQAHSGILAVREEGATVLAVTKQSGLRDFAFNRVYGETSGQQDVYDNSAKRLVMEFLNGQSASLICYGQTGSGKTFTMFSPPATRGPLGVTVPPPRGLRGVVPRACEDILETVGAWREQGHTAQLGVSYVEVFGSEVSDLLRMGQVVGQDVEGRYGASRATDRVGHRYVLDGHTEHLVDSWEDVARLLENGDDAKRRAATAMNERSTRAHTLLVLSLTTDTKRSRFYFADLGGSEQMAKSKADADTKAPVIVTDGVETRIGWEEYYRHRQRIQETCNINKGLFSLKRVIEALHSRCRLAQQGVPHHLLPYVPYQDSKLTMILQEALGGSARTMVLATATMDPEHADESLQTLRFAEMCSQVQKRQEENQGAAVRDALGQVAKEIAQVEAAIVAKERWETRLVRRSDVDTVAGAFGEGNTRVREEVIPTSVLVGAEAERERLEMLLQKQQELEGLVGGLGKDYREMKASEEKDGGKGIDFRDNLRFSAKMKAHDFENEIVLADAVRFMFRKAESAGVAFGETEETTRKRLSRTQIQFGYFRIARALKAHWEDALASGAESRSFGKAMMDRLQGWSKQLKLDPYRRERALSALLKECAFEPQEFDAVAFADVPEDVSTIAGKQVTASDSSAVPDVILRNGWD